VLAGRRLFAIQAIFLKSRCAGVACKIPFWQCFGIMGELDSQDGVYTSSNLYLMYHLQALHSHTVSLADRLV
jgi:hypothetical protein